MSLLRLNLGSGPRATEGWVCLDRSPNVALSRFPPLKRLLRKLGLLADQHMAAWDPAVVRADVRALPFPDSSAEAVYSSHTLEHLHLYDAKTVLQEAHRVLVHGGVLRLALPDATEAARILLAAEAAGDLEAGLVYNESLLAHPLAPLTTSRRFLRRTGGHVHYWQPTPLLLTAMLREAGFSEVGRKTFQEGECPDLDKIETRPESFFVEARKGQSA